MKIIIAILKIGGIAVAVCVGIIIVLLGFSALFLLVMMAYREVTEEIEWIRQHKK